MIPMNKQRRDSLRQAVGFLSQAESIVERVSDKEQDCMDNTPENFQESERYAAMENAVDQLNDALTGIGEVKEMIRAAMA